VVGAGQLQAFNSSFDLVKNIVPAEGISIIRVKYFVVTQTNPDTPYIAASFSDNSVRLYEPGNNWNLKHTFSGFTGLVFGMDYTRNGSVNLVVCGSRDQTIRFFRISNGNTFGSNIQTGQIVQGISVTAGFNVVAACGSFIFIYDTGRNLIQTLVGHTNTVMDVLVLANRLVASSSLDNTVRIWNLATNRTRYTLRGHTLPVYGITQVATDILASGSNDTTIRLWNITSGSLLRNLTGHTDAILYSVNLFSCSLLASGSIGTEGFKLWNIYSGQSVNVSTGGLRIQSLTVFKPTISMKKYILLIIRLNKLKFKIVSKFSF
jgi:WD40 repeat protein